MTNGTRTLLLAPVLALALAGCGPNPTGEGIATAGGAASPSASGSASAPAAMDDEERRLAFTECLREQGLDIADPAPGAPGGVRFRVQDGDRDKVEAAMQACRQYAPNGGEPRKLDPDQLARVRELAKCMRANGVPDFPDPDADGRVRIERYGRLDRDDEAFEAAMEKCRQYAPGPRVTQGSR